LTDGRFPARGRPAVLDLPWAEVRGDGVADEEDRLDEERRLCFVAMTRARDELWLSHHSSGPGGRGARRPSQFIPEALDAPVTRSTVHVVPVLDSIPAPMKVAPQPPSARRAGPRPSFSFSQLEDYLDCPERYRLRHVVGLPSPPHHALSYGRALHEAVAFFHLESARGIDVTEDELLAAFDRAWTPEGFLSREHEEARYYQGREALKRFRLQQLADPAPVVGVEKTFELDIDGIRVRGRMDRIDDTEPGAVIVDYKSSDVRDQRKADQKARESLQLQVYALAHQKASGALPAEMRLHFIDSGFVGRTRPEPGRLEKTTARIREASDGIAAGSFPARPNPVSCGFCPFRQVCSSSAA
jgi:DNA helicase-2/ATP-dependent DNA helicase PcrA